MKKGNGSSRTTKRTLRRELPEGCDAREIVVRELDGHDELDLAVRIEQEVAAAPVLATNFTALQDLKQRESLRLSLVEVDGDPVNVEGVPYLEMDSWGRRTMTALTLLHNKLNGLEGDEVKNLLAGTPYTRTSPAAVGAGETPSGGSATELRSAG